MKRQFGIIFLSAVLSLGGIGTAVCHAQGVDPQIQKIVEASKKEMPGVTYEMVRGAKEEGKLMFYHLAMPGAMPVYIQEFKKRFPFIAVQEYFTSGGPLFQKFTSEARARKNVADIWQHTDIAAMNKVADEGLLLKYKAGCDAEYPEAYKRSSLWYPFCYAQVVVAWNTDISPDKEAVKRLKTWGGVADPYWDDKKTGAIVIQSGGTLHTAYYMLQEKYGMEIWKKLAARKPQFYEGVNPLADAVASGEVALALAGAEGSYYMRWMRGAPVHWTNPDPRIAVPYGQAIAKDAPHPNAAKLFQEFVLSEQGQKIVATEELPSFRVGDLRKHVKEPWYSSPAAYSYDMDKISKAMRGPDGLISQWNKVFLKK